MNVFITGISGFAGSTLVRYFNRKEDLKLFGHSRNISVTEAKYCDVNVTLVPSYSSKIFDTHKIDAVVHLAGIAHDLGGRYKEQDYYQVNFEQTRMAYEHFLHSGASKFIFVSSVKAVVDHADFPIKEETAPRPLTAYGKSKRLAEEFIFSQSLPSSKRVYVLRPCMIHGPGNKGNLNLLYRFVKSGLPFPFGAFANQRSFLGADNFSFFIEQYLTKNIPSDVYNVSDDDTLSTNEVVRLISQALGRQARIWSPPKGIINFATTFYGKQMVSKLTDNMIVPNHKITSLLGVNPPFSIQEGITRTVRSFNE